MIFMVQLDILSELCDCINLILTSQIREKKIHSAFSLIKEEEEFL